MVGLSEVQFFDVLRSLADFDLDDDVDQADFGHIQACLTGDAVGPPRFGCTNSDLDGDGDVDMTDLNLFRQCISAPGVPADPLCLE